LKTSYRVTCHIWNFYRIWFIPWYLQSILFFVFWLIFHWCTNNSQLTHCSVPVLLCCWCVHCRRDYNRGPRGGGRNTAANFPARREDVADKLVNQLQGLVSALTYVSAQLQCILVDTNAYIFVSCNKVTQCWGRRAEFCIMVGRAKALLIAITWWKALAASWARLLVWVGPWDCVLA